MTQPRFVYVASSWRCPAQPRVVDAVRGAGIECYDFRNPPGGKGVSWPLVGSWRSPGRRTGGADLEPMGTYLRMVNHPAAQAVFQPYFDAMCDADTFVLLLPCGKSGHLELGWAVGAGKRTAILLEDPVAPELMYLMVDKLAVDIPDLLRWMAAGDESA